MTVTSRRLAGVLDLARQRARRGGVTLAHVGGQDQHVAPARGVRAGRARFAVSDVAFSYEQLRPRADDLLETHPQTDAARRA